MLSWHTISSPFVAINNIYNIFCFDINSPTPKVFIDFIVKVSCIVRHIDCMASTKLKRGKIFLSFNFFLQSYIWGGFAWRSNPLPIYIIYHFLQKRSPFRIPSIDKWYPFHTPRLELCNPCSWCKFTVFSYELVEEQRPEKIQHRSTPTTQKVWQQIQIAKYP